jgi:putative membrane protein
MHSIVQASYFAAAVMLAGSAFAQNPTSMPPSQTQPGTSQPGQPGMQGRPTTPSTFPDASQDQRQMTDPFASDREFVKDAAEGSALEIELGKLAQEKGSSEAVKEFGKRMVEDHTRAGENLKQAAAKVNIQASPELSRKSKKAQEKLSKLSGPDFDREYAKMMVSDHKNDVKAFERESKSGAAPTVKEFANKTLPTLQEHYKLAQQLANPSKTAETGSADREKNGAK